MGFVDRDACELALLVDGRQEFAKVLSRAELWCDVDEACVRMTTLEVILDAFSFGICRTRGDCFGWNSAGSSCIDLIGLFFD